MAKILLICPFCQKKLETSEENVGREGQCPACENVFPVTAPKQATPSSAALRAGGEGWLGAAGEYEYQEMTALSGAAAVVVCLGLLVVASLTQWVKPYSLGSDFMPGEKVAFLIVALVCCGFIAVSFLARKSLVPAVLVSAAWGTMALIWSGGILQSMRHAVKSYEDTALSKQVSDSVATTSGIYFALVASILILAAGVYFYYQCRDSDTFRHIGAFLVITQVLAIVAAVLIVLGHVKPAIRDRLPKLPGEPAAQASVSEPEPFWESLPRA